MTLITFLENIRCFNNTVQFRYSHKFTNNEIILACDVLGGYHLGNANPQGISKLRFTGLTWCQLWVPMCPMIYISNQIR